MATKKISELTADASPTSDDLVELANDPGGTPASRKATLSNVTKGLAAASASLQGVVTTGSQTFAGAKTFVSIVSTGGAQLYNTNDNGVNIGLRAGVANSNAVIIGYESGGDPARTYLDIDACVFVGRHSGYGAIGGNSVCIGHAAAQYGYSSASAVHIGYEASRNPNQDAGFLSPGAVTIGYQAGRAMPTQQYSTLVGYQAGAAGTSAVTSVFIGYQAGYATVAANTSVMIGPEAGKNATNAQNSVLIGNQAGMSLSRHHTLVIDGNTNYSPAGNTALIYGEFDNRVLQFNATTTKANNVEPIPDNTSYLGRNDDDTPKAWKGLILKDTTNGKYYRVEVISGVVTATDLTD